MIQTIITVIFVIGGIKLLFGKNIQTYHSHWQTAVPDFKFSSIKFYELLQQKIQSNQIKGLKISKTTLRENTIVSPYRIYLKVTWHELEYNICCAWAVNSTFFSSWLLLKNSLFQKLILKIPFIGNWLFNKLYPLTFYKHDTTSIFMSYIHNALLSVVDEIIKDTGTRLSEQQRTPIMKSIFER